MKQKSNNSEVRRGDFVAWLSPFTGKRSWVMVVDVHEDAVCVADKFGTWEWVDKDKFVMFQTAQPTKWEKIKAKINKLLK